MYVDRVNWLVIECRVVENASTGDDICDKVVEIFSGAGGARGPVGESDNDSSDREDAIKPKKTRPNCSRLEEGNKNGGRGSERQ